MFDGPDERPLEHGQQSAHLVVDVAEAAGLRAVAVDGDRLAAQGLADEVGHDAAVVGRMRGP